jgi:cyclic-di-GMP-binding protein
MGAMADSSFDIVSKVDPMELQNAVTQAQKELTQRYDFKGVDAEITQQGESLTLFASSEERVKAVLDVLQSKLIKRGISLKSFDTSDPDLQGKRYKITGQIKNGIASDQAKKISQIIREEGPKTTKAQIQGDELRVTSKSRDDLQAVIALLKGKDLDVDLQFVNYR